MIWAQIALLVIKLLMELPAIKEWLDRIFGALSKARPLQAARESGKILAALRAKCHEAETGKFAVSCPLEALAKELESKYGP
jgi:hypothetical protein